MRFKISTFLMGIALLALSPFSVYGQLLDPVEYQLISAPDSVKAGEVFTIEVEALIDENWHLYSIHNHPDAGPYPTQLSVVSDDAMVAGKIEETEAEIAYDPNFDTELGWHTASTVFKVPVAVQPSLRGDKSIEIEVFYQVCDDKSCLPPKTKTVEASVFVYDGSESPYVGFEEKEALSNSPYYIRYLVVALFLIGGVLALLFFNKSQEE